VLPLEIFRSGRTLITRTDKTADRQMSAEPFIIILTYRTIQHTGR